jgi:hypothetical protein
MHCKRLSGLPVGDSAHFWRIVRVLSLLAHRDDLFRRRLLISPRQGLGSLHRAADYVLRNLRFGVTIAFVQSWSGL